MAQLGEEELDSLVAELAQFGTQDVVDADMVCISGQIGDGERGVLVEVVRLYEALEEIPTHLGRLIGALRRVGEEQVRELKNAMLNWPA